MWTVFFSVLLLGVNYASSVSVTGISPHFGSTNGGTTLTISGSDFAGDSFNNGDGNEHLGNEVFLYNSFQTYVCDVDKDATDENTITCYTQAMPEGTYYLTLKIDGEEVSNTAYCNGNQEAWNCRFEPIWWRTPTIDNITPLTSTPWSVITLTGRTFTDKAQATVAASSNDITASIRRVWVSGQVCNLRSTADELYGVQLFINSNTGTSSNYGEIKCRVEGSNVKSQNVSYLVDGEFGRSKPSPSIMKISGDYKLYNYQTYATFQSVSPTTGSIHGGTIITVTGTYLKDNSLDVRIGGETCEVINREDPSITCRTSPSATTRDVYPGSRGIRAEIYPGLTDAASIENVLYEDYEGDKHLHVADQAFVSYTASSTPVVVRMKGFFVPAKDGTYLFTSNLPDAQIYVSTDNTRANKVLHSIGVALKSDSMYYYEVIHTSASAKIELSFNAYLEETDYRSTQTSMSRDEIQTITTTSPDDAEIQKITLNNWEPNDLPENEVITLCISCSGSECSGEEEYIISLHGVNSGDIQSGASAIIVQNAINQLPTMSGDSVQVTKAEEHESCYSYYNITVQSYRGTLPLTAIAKVVDTVVLTIGVEVDAVPDKNSFTVALNGIPSGHVVVGNTDSLASAVQGLFGTGCPAGLGASIGFGTVLFFDFEVNTVIPGSRTAEDSYCGSFSLKNPGQIMLSTEDVPSYSVAPSSQFCLAYKGDVESHVILDYTFTGITSSDVVSDQISVPIELSADDWVHHCMNLHSLLNTQTIGQNFAITSIRIWLPTSDNDFFVDNIFLGLMTRTEDELAVLQSQQRPPASTQHRVSSVTVTMADDAYEVTMVPVDCAADFPLLEIAYSTIQDGVYTDSSWGSSSITVERIQAASPAVGGTFDLTLPGGGTLEAIPYDVEPEVLKSEIESLSDIESVEVTRTGSCRGYEWKVTFLSPGGRKEAMTANGDNLVNDRADINTLVLIKGGIYMEPLPADWIRAAYPNPQVEIAINNVPCKCDGACAFAWSEDDTPEVTDATMVGTEWTVTGTGFSTVIENNAVTIGGVGCTVNTASETSITCTLVESPASLSLVVNVLEKGDSNAYEVTVSLSVTDMSPTSGSELGGTQVTITGAGFSEGVGVTIGGSVCTVKSVDYTTILCTTGPTEVGAKTVNVAMGTENADVGTQFTFEAASASGTVDPTSFSVLGGTMTITGTGFGFAQTTGSTVSIGSHTAVVTDWSDTSITVTAPSLPQGTYSLQLYIYPFGYAQLNVNTVEYLLRVDTVSPSSVSLLGGNELIINGAGFNEDTEVTVDGVTCPISAHSSTSLTCKMGSCGKTHVISNYGNSADHGVGYAWNITRLTIAVGDVVEFHWDAVAKFGTLQVFSTEDASSVEYDNNGFNSGDGTKNGVFAYRFNLPGKYYYGGCSGSECDIFLRGLIIVEEVSESITADVSVTLNGHEAAYVGTAMTITCESSLTPIITDISINTGTSNDLITITGVGFSAVDGATTVHVGDAECTVVGNPTETEVSCKVSTDTELTVGLNQEVVVTVANKGSSRTDIRDHSKRYFALTPHVASVSPTTGSLAGGTKLTITGGGLSKTSEINIGGVECTVGTATYTSVECVTGSSVAGSGPVDVTVTENGLTMGATCSPECPFEYRDEDTPTMTDVTPKTVTGTTSLTITGTGFGTGGVTVKIGENDCNTADVTDGQITCEVNGLPVGTHLVDVIVIGKGRAAKDSGTNFEVTSMAEIAGVSPSSGSIMGGTELTITGNGFVEGSTEVAIGDSSTCTLVSVSLSTIVCTTPASTAATTVNIIVTSNEIPYEAQEFQYSEDSTPTITAINPNSGEPGDAITVTGTKFIVGTSVAIGGVICSVTSTAETSIACELGSRYGGSAEVSATVPGLGLANVATGVSFTYTFGVSGINPNSGSLGGGQSVTITGNGFTTVSKVEICGNECSVTGATSSTSITCTTPASATAQACDVQVTNSDVDSKSIPQAYTYDENLTPVIASVQPSSGGTGGGTVLTITGSGLGGASSVMIDGSVCDINTNTETEIECVTNSHQGTVQAKVEVHFDAKGIAPTDNANFYYIDKWSSVFTWGGESLPQEDEFVVIQEGQVVLLDTVTNKLKMLLIMGGSLIFEDAGEVHLHADNILITHGGLLQIGTAAGPYSTGRAQITMHGHLRSPELPIYGAKTLGVRDGRLEMHGKRVDITWALLDETASAGSTQIVLQKPVPWSVGDEIVIATTGLRHSQSENEQRTIQAINIANGKTTITLTEPLTYEHLGTTETYDTENHGTVTMEYRAEVGLLSRNIKFQGSDDIQFHDNIEACPDGFDTGMFSTQTCFQGRFGEEVGSDQFGASIMIHSKEPTTDPTNPVASAFIEFVEFHYVGQAFRLGRYPVHWHLMGNVENMYVRGCSFHKSFNRAVTIHNTHNLLVEHNVLYNIMGGAIFIEDGIETGNTIQYNLAVFVIQSTSLLNDDITPAAYWATNPDNTLQHNHAAGGTHFGFWYRMNQHPDGPSFTPNICQQKAPLRAFQNNTVHSCGWFGLWIFQTYKPMEGGGCDSTTPSAAKFRSLTAWHCEKGAEWVDGGALQFHDFRLSSNEDSGIDIKSISAATWDDDSSNAMVKNTVIIGHADFWESSNYESKTGLIIPMAPGLWMDGVTFINLNKDTHAAVGLTSISGTCTFACGGFYVKTKRLEFINTSRRLKWRWEHEGVFSDQDGTFADQSPTPANIVPYSDLYKDPNSECIKSSDIRFGGDLEFPAMICPSSVRFHRFAMNNPSPSSLEFKNAIVTNEYGNSTSLYLKKRLTHKFGWMFLLRSKMTYTLVFENVEQITNISYNAAFYDFMDGDYVIMEHEFYQKPDRIILYWGDTQEIDTATPLTPDNPSRTWYFDIANTKLSYIIARQPSRRKRGTFDVTSPDISQFSVLPQIYRCYYTDCITPINTGGLEDIHGLPGDAIRITNATVDSECLTLDSDNGDMTIPEGCNVLWAVPNTETNKFFIYGVLIFDKEVQSITLSATHIIVQGQLIAGYAKSDPYTSHLRIILRGDHRTPEVAVNSGLTLGSKAIGCFGTCHLHGLDTGVVWTRLSQTADATADQITLQDSVTWEVGNSITIAPSGYNPHYVETRTITAVSDDGKTLTLDSPLEYEHKGITHDFGPGWSSVDMSAEVALLTRNIVIEGESYAEINEELFGARVLVANVNTYNAKALFSNVHFYKSGQDGWYDSFDPRYSIAWVSAGAGSEITECVFHMGFGPAIGVFGTNSFSITRNVIDRTIHESIVLEGSTLILEENLVIQNYFEGSYGDRFEDQNFKYPAAINVEKATYLTMKNNVIAGADRVGFRIAGQPCDESAIEKWSGNVVHGALIGVLQMEATIGGCSLVNGFTIYKAWDYGYYHQTPDSVQVENTAIIDCTVGYLPLVVGPAALSHEFQNKYAQMTNCLIVGRSDQSACTSDIDENSKNLRLRKIAGKNKKASTPPTGGVSGIMLPMFESAFNGATFKSFELNTKYPALYGILRINDVTAYNFASTCDNKIDKLFFTNPANEDAFHPTHATNFTLHNVDHASIAFFARPSPSKINPSDCVDMQCDAKLKVMIKDTDGSLLGQPGTILPQAEYGWDDADKAHLGVGDYRIPKTMITTADGVRIPYDEITPHKGIVRNDACSYVEDWQAYNCIGDTAHNYRMVVIESLDGDTETRRLSPIGLLCDGYIDLNNGPQDHGWCNGYTCQKRISTFYMIFAMGTHNEVHFSGTPPKDFRIHLLNADASDKFTIAIWIPNPQTLEVSDGIDNKRLAQNSYLEGGRTKLAKPPISNPDLYKPTLDSLNGANFLDLETRLLYISVGGENAVVTVRQLPTITVAFGFPAVSVDEFFGDKIVGYLAALLGVPEDKIRFVNVVRETTGRKRRSETVDVEVQIETGTVAEAETAEKKIQDAFQDQAVTVDSVQAISLRSSGPLTDEAIAETDAALASGEVPANGRSIIVPTKMKLCTTPVGEEKSQFTTPITVHLLDDSDTLVATTGTWTVTVTFAKTHTNSDPDAAMTGTIILPFTDGIATFSDIMISHSGTYVLTFASQSSNISDITEEITVNERTVNGKIDKLNDQLPKEGTDLQFDIQLVDANTNNLEEPNFKYTYKVDVGFDDSSMYTATIAGTTTFTFDDTTAKATITGVSLANVENYKIYNIRFRLYTDPPSSYDKTIGIEEIQIYPTNEADYIHADAPVQVNLKLKTTSDYNTILGSNDKNTMETSIYNNLDASASKVYLTPLTASEDTDSTLTLTGSANSKSQDDMDNLLVNLESSGILRFGGTEIRLASNCGIVTDDVCYGQTTTMAVSNTTTTTMTSTTAKIVADDYRTAIIIFSTLGACALLSIIIVVTTCIVKRQNTVRKVSAMRCMNNSQASTDSGRPLSNSVDSFQPGQSGVWVSPNLDYDEAYRMTPVAAP